MIGLYVMVVFILGGIGTLIGFKIKWSIQNKKDLLAREERLAAERVK